METLLIYLAKVNIALAMFYLLYLLFFRKDTFIRIRRYYFLSAIIFSLSYSIMNVTVLGNLINMTPETVATETSVYIGEASMGEISMGEMIVDDAAEATTPIDWMLIGKSILLIGVSLLSLRFLWQLFSIIRIKSRSEKRSLFGYLFHQLKDEITPFSFFSWIFIHTDTHTEKELKQILLHEHTHVRQWHSLDILLAELLRIAFWWNPVVWVMKRDIAINLEYLADQAVLQEGVESTEYQYHLLQMTNHETAVQIVNNFNVSQLKQRIIMMNSEKSPMGKLTKYLSILPLTLLLITANSVFAQQNEQQQEPVKIENKDSKDKSRFHEVTKNLDKLAAALKSEVKYPQDAKENGVHGDVIASFIIEEDGSIINSNIEVGLSPSLNQEAIRVINAMPKLKQFTYTEDDEPLKVKYNAQFAFRLDGEKASFDVAMRGYTVLSIADKTGDDKPLFIVDGVKMDKEFDMSKIDRSDIEHTTIYQKEAAMATYGEEGKNGAVMISTKEASETKVSDNSKKDNEDKNEVIVRGYGSMEEATPQALAKKFGNGEPLYVIDDVKMGKGFDLNQIKENIESVSILKDKSALAIYGDEGKNGVVIVYTKSFVAEKKKVDDDVFVVVEDQPEFPGGMQALMAFVAENTRFPAELANSDIEGRVVVDFIVNKDGSLSNIKVVRSLHPLLDAEAVRVIKTMPKWSPGTQRGLPVKVRYTLPILFKLEEGEKDTTRKNIVERHGNPLVLIGGVKMGSDFHMLDINPEDIESFSILKDDSDIKEYGEEGKNGVILVTLKKGVKFTLSVKNSIAQIKGEREDVFIAVEEQPEFPGGKPALEKYLTDNIIYPLQAKRNKIQGRVITSFIVNKDGSISDAQIVRGPDPSLYAEAIRVIEAMPKWKPGMQKGKAVNVRLTIPVVFRLNKDEATNNLNGRVPTLIKDKLISNKPLVIVDGEKMPKGFDIEDINQSDIESISVLKNEEAISKYADEGKNGVVIITLKNKVKFIPTTTKTLD